MNRDIENYIRNRHICNKYRRANSKEPMIVPEIPSSPWEKVGTDIFELNNKYYLLVVDYFSKYVELNIISKITRANVITNLK